MQQLKYKLMAPVGPGRFTKSGNVLSLLCDIPYFFISKIIPPMRVVNEVLKKGVLDAGMSGGCRWTPVQLSESEYAELVVEMEEKRFKNISPPDWVATAADWHSWCCELVWGIPALENRNLSDEISALERKREAAEKRSDEPEAVRILIQINDLCMKHSRFLDKHRSPKPKLPLFRRG